MIILDSPGNTIGGIGAGEGNVIINNGRSGIRIVDDLSTGNLVQGNFIGTDAFTALGNGRDGVRISGASGNTIGGAGAGEGNVISGNSISGLRIHTFTNEDASNNTVQGNFIGTKADGTSPLGNSGNGVHIFATGGGNAADDNIIGGTADGEANIIAHNGEDGVQVECFNSVCTSANGNTIRGNSIYANGGIGIELIGGANANGDIAAPTDLEQTGGFVSGESSCDTCTVDVYSDADGQGRIHHGSTTTAGDGSWELTTPDIRVSGPKITATVTDNGNTSRFSTAFEFSPTCAQVATATIITAAKGQSPKNNPKVSNAITAKMVDAADYGPTASRIKICENNQPVIVVTDLTGTPAVDNLGGNDFTPDCGGGICTLTYDPLTLTSKYKAKSFDGKDTDRVTLLPVTIP